MNLRVLIIVALLFCLSLSARAQTNPDQNHVPTEEQIAKYKRLAELLKHPTFITLRLASARRDSTNEEPSTTPSPYTTDQWMNFELFITQNSTENLVLTSSTGDIYQQNRLILIRDGDIVPYRRDVQRQVETAGRDMPYGSARSKTLEPRREYRLGLFALDSWYDSPLKPGHYQLTIRRQFAFDGDWVESNPVTFDILPPKPPDSDSDLDRLDTKVTSFLEKKMPGWEGKRGEPIQGDKNVLVEFWTDSSRNRIVKISIVPRASVEEARNAIEEFVKYDREKEQLRGFGDDAYAWGYGLSNIVFRRGKLTVFVSTTADVDADSDASLLSRDQKAARMKSEMSRLSKDVAKQVATAIDQD